MCVKIEALLQKEKRENYAGKTKEMDSAHCALSDWNYGNSLTTEQNRIKKIFWGDIQMQNSCKVLTRYIINNGSSNNVDL